MSEAGFRESGVEAVGDHVRGAGSGFLGILHPEQRFGDQRVSWNGPVGKSEEFRSKSRRQFPWVPHFYAVGKN